MRRRRIRSPGSIWPLQGGGFLAILLLFAAFLAWRVRQGTYDLVVQNGRVFDGIQFLPRGTRIGLRKGRIAAVGRLYGARSHRWIDAGGSVVAPGFIDVHTHVERNIPSGAVFTAPNFVRQGITTIITGNCGTSRLNLASLFRDLERNGTQVNVASLIGHNSIREEVLGKSGLVAQKGDIDRMARMVGDGMRSGALGLSTGLAYAPGVYAGEEEVIELARAAARYGGLYCTHLRDEGIGSEEALHEALRIREATSIHLHISHCKIAARSLWGRAAQRLALLERMRVSGAPITLDVYAYDASSSSTDLLVPPEFRGPQVDWRKVLRDPRQKKRLFAGMQHMRLRAGFSDYSYARIASFGKETLNGKNIPELAEALSLRASKDPLRTQMEALLYLLTHGGAQMVYFDMSEADMLEYLKSPETCFGTDSAVRHPGQNSSHPRSVGNFPKILGTLVRDRHVLTLAEALRKMTSLPAGIFGLHDRGRIAPGAAADLTVFNPDTIGAQNSFAHPAVYPDGISWVIVNGTAVCQKNEVALVWPGTALRRTPGGRKPSE